MKVVCPVCGKTYRIPEEKLAAGVVKARCSQCRSILNISKETGTILVEERGSVLSTSHQDESPPDTAAEPQGSSTPADSHVIDETDSRDDSAAPPSRPSPVYSGSATEQGEKDYKAISIFVLALAALVVVSVLGVRSCERGATFKQFWSSSRLNTFFEKGSAFLSNKHREKQFEKMTPFQRHLAQGHRYFRDKKYDEALKQYNLAIRSDPDKYEAYYWRGQLFVLRKEYEKAIQDMSRVLELNPSYRQAHRTLGWAYCEAGRYDEAIQALDRSIDLDPKDGWTFYERGLCYYKKGNLAAAVRDVKTACDLGYKPGCEVYRRYQ
jgi:predicted Zn finger-like uncharacterized protein